MELSPSPASPPSLLGQLGSNTGTQIPRVRLVRCSGDSLQAPKEGWQEHVAYLCVGPFDKNMESKPTAPAKKRMPFDNIDTSFGNGGGMEGPPHTTWSTQPAAKRGRGGPQRGFGGPMGMNGGGMGMNGNGMGMNGMGMGMNGNGMGMGMGGGMGGFDDGF